MSFREFADGRLAEDTGADEMPHAPSPCTLPTHPPHAPSPSDPVGAEDTDVAAERKLVESGRADGAPVVVCGMRKVYGLGAHQKVAVDRLSLHIEQGACFGLLGPNGAGKSTTVSVRGIGATLTDHRLTVKSPLCLL